MSNRTDSQQPSTSNTLDNQASEDSKKEPAATVIERAKDVAERLERTAEERVQRTGKKLLDAMQAQPRTATLAAGGAAFALASAVGAAEVAVAAAGAYAAYRWLRRSRADSDKEPRAA